MTKHNLREAVEIAEADLDAASAAVENATKREEEAEHVLELAQAALVDSDCPREWVVSDEGGEFWSGFATSGDEAIDEADPTTDATDFNDVAKTIWYEVNAVCHETDETVSRIVRVDPPEPKCVSDEHDWQSPHNLVGGIKENPGVYGHGGGVFIKEVCIRCGCGRVTDTWAQCSATGRQGLTSVEYFENEYDVSEEE